MDINNLKKKYSDTSIKEKKEALEQKMQNAHGNGENMSKLSMDLGYYSQLDSHINEITKNIEKYEQASQILSEEENELKELATIELEESKENIERLELEIKKLQIEREFTDEDDSRNVILEIRAGAGGEEASLFAGNLFDMYKNYSLNNGWDVQIIDSNVSETGGYKEVIAQINGKNVYKRLKYESGVHRVQRVPVTESSGRIHTSTASVAIMPEAKDIDVVINPEDIRIDVMRASGAGGQCVNKTDSAVRITHFPSGIVVSCQETKHQAQNKEKAMANLRSRLYEKKKSEEDEKRSSMRSSQIGSAMRAEKIRTYNFPQNRITDHRIKQSWHNIESVMSGNLEQLIEDVREGIQLQAIENEK
ncbi:MAG: Peptide chain release factor 1 [candidate division WS6 bacterium GW2011_GWE1_34_7]|uniref:Peptide chain release factor 1 n=1 Tax=candidate division WS6 bacterium GW2011_GWE1_34_7 TaxID=1619093 RepID=A0A0G0DL45_9BACT|nr:MAG: Peptide chain release factor 1 [candidate division WS6 bacterium GW2011_GWE1_34_7]